MISETVWKVWKTVRIERVPPWLSCKRVKEKKAFKLPGEKMYATN